MPLVKHGQRPSPLGRSSVYLFAGAVAEKRGAAHDIA